MENDLYIKLLKLIRTRYLESDKLPPEEVLAAELGISRVKLRDVLAVLEVQGYINRKKGVGTLINRCLVNEPVRLDIDAIYEETVREAGFRARTQVRSIQYLEKTPEAIAKILGVDQSESTYAAQGSYNISDWEYTLLCRIVSSEYGSDWVPVEEKAKIVASVMAMVYNPNYPDTIEEVLDVSCAPWGFDKYYDYYMSDSIYAAVDYYFTSGAYDGWTCTSWSGDGTWNYFS